MSETISKRERVSRLIQRAGLASNNQAQALCTSGAVSIDGAPIFDWGARAEPHNVVTVNGVVVPWIDGSRDRDPRYYGPRKAWRYHCSPDRHIPPDDSHSIGRFKDRGLHLRTGSLEISDQVREGVRHAPKVYTAKIFGDVLAADIDAVASGTHNGQHFKPAEVRLRGQSANNTYVTVKTTSGKCQGLMCVFAGRVSNVKRVQIGSVVLGDLKPGEREEVDVDALLAEFGSPTE